MEIFAQYLDDLDDWVFALVSFRDRLRQVAGFAGFMFIAMLFQVLAVSCVIWKPVTAWLLLPCCALVLFSITRSAPTPHS